MFGITPTNAVAVYIYSALDNSLITTFSSQTAAGAAYGVSRFTVSRYIRSGVFSLLIPQGR